MAKKNPAAKPPTKVELFNNMAARTGLTKKQVADVVEALNEQITKAISAGGPGVFVLPGMLKVVVVHRAATKKRQVRNPATGEMQWAEPKPARKVVKVRPLKALKDLVV
jgi:nucleoid DNA-binding protein